MLLTAQLELDGLALLHQWFYKHGVLSSLFTLSLEL